MILDANDLVVRAADEAEAVGPQRQAPYMIRMYASGKRSTMCCSTSGGRSVSCFSSILNSNGAREARVSGGDFAAERHNAFCPASSRCSKIRSS